MITWLDCAGNERVPVLLNAGAWSHYPDAVRAACATVRTMAHISNTRARLFRHHSVVGAVGLSDRLGIDALRPALEHIAAVRPTIREQRPRGGGLA
jgi:3-dehydroquinate dehydratase-2